MTTALIPIPGNATIWSDLLSKPKKPVVMTAEEFDALTQGIMVNLLVSHFFFLYISINSFSI